MILRYHDNTEEGKKRRLKIESILPEKTLIETFLSPKIESLKPTLIKMLYVELDIYRNFPKKNLADVKKAKEELKTFDPRNNTTCFQGKAFKVSDNYEDAELTYYRKAVGTFNHSEWGDATLLEIWGGDHFKNHKKMVESAFKYGTGITKQRPVLKFHVNPLFSNESSGRLKLTPEQRQYKKDMDELLAQAIVHGVKKPKRR